MAAQLEYQHKFETLPSPAEAGRQWKHKQPGTADPTPEDSRIVSWLGNWKCGVCGNENDLNTGCKTCKLVEIPCKAWCLGRCRRRRCPYRHLHFDVASMGQKPTEWPKGIALVVPHEDFIWDKVRKGVAAVPLPPPPEILSPLSPMVSQIGTVSAVRSPVSHPTIIPCPATENQPNWGRSVVPAMPVHASSAVVHEVQEDLDAVVHMMMEHLGIRDFSYSADALLKS